VLDPILPGHQPAMRDADQPRKGSGGPREGEVRGVAIRIRHDEIVRGIGRKIDQRAIPGCVIAQVFVLFPKMLDLLAEPDAFGVVLVVRWALFRWVYGRFIRGLVGRLGGGIRRPGPLGLPGIRVGVARIHGSSGSRGDGGIGTTAHRVDALSIHHMKYSEGRIESHILPSADDVITGLKKLYRPRDDRPADRTNDRYAGYSAVPVYSPVASVFMPDRATDDVLRHYRSWKRLAPLGLIGVGFGASLIGHATLKKASSDRTWPWVVAGTLGLVALNAGLSMFGDAVKHRTLYEINAKS